MKKIIVFILFIVALAGILHQFGAFDNMLTSKDLDTAVATTLNTADRQIDDAVKRRIYKSFMNK